jgi:hypothetical protein
MSDSREFPKISQREPERDPYEYIKDAHATDNVKELLHVIDKVGDIFRLGVMESLDDADALRLHWGSGMTIIEEIAAKLESNLSEHFMILNISSSAGWALRRARGYNQTWEDFFARLGIKAPAPAKQRNRLRKELAA